MKKFNYEAIEPGYYHKAMLYGGRYQKFWHRKKFELAAGRIPQEKITVLDIGCGPGSFFHILRRTNKKANLIGIDISPKQLKYAKKTEPSARFIEADATKLPFRPESIDIVTMLEVIEHLPKETEQKILKQIHRVLKKNGKLALTTPNYFSHWPVIEFFWNRLSPVSYEEQHINKKTVRSMKKSLFRAGFRKVRVKTFFIASPGAAIVSPKIANWLFKLEKKLFPMLGAIMIVEAVK